jgi:putative cell wall-binding protein
VRVAGPDRIATAIAVSQSTFPASGSAGAVVLTRADGFADALAGIPLAAALNAPILLTPSQQLDSSVLGEIERVLPGGGKVVVLGGTAALSDAVVQSLTAAKFSVTRYGGGDRFATAVVIADQGLGDPATVFEATGTDFGDALSGAPAAAVTHGAILLTNGSSQAGATAAYLSAHAPATRIAIGGPASAADNAATSSVVGADRYDTAARVASTFFSAPTLVGVASGLTFADALSGGAAVAHLSAPMLLAGTTGGGSGLASPVMTYLATQAATIQTIDVFGGTSAVPDSTAATARHAA